MSGAVSSTVRKPLGMVAVYTAGMECCWLAALLLALDAMLAHPHGLALASVVVVPYAAAHALATQLRRLRKPWLEWVLCPLLLLIIWIWMGVGPLPGADDFVLPRGVTDYRSLFAGIAAAIAWLRGWLLQHRELGPFEVNQGFNVGLVALLPAALLTQAGGELMLLAVAFVAFALLAHRQARASSHEEGGGAPLGVSVTLIALGCALAVGVVLAALVNRQLIAEMLTLPAWLAGQLGAWLDAGSDVPLSDLDGLDSEASKDTANPFRRTEPPVWLHWLFALFTGNEALLGTLVATLLVVILGIVAWVAWKRRGRRAREASDGLRFEHSSMSLRAALLLLLQLLARQWRRCLHWLSDLGGLRTWLRSRRTPAHHMHGVRGIYRLALLRLGRQGWPRAAHESPEEYCRRLLPVWRPVKGSNAPAPAEQSFAALTAAFVADCYGPRPLAHGDVHVDWRQLRRDLNTVKPRRKKGRIGRSK